MEKAATVSFTFVFFFFSNIPNYLTTALSIKLLIRRWRSLPSPSWQGELDPIAAIPCSRVSWRRQLQWVWLFFCFPPTITIFLIASFFHLNCSSVGHASRPPSVDKGIKGPMLPYLPATCLQKAASVSVPPPFYFPPTIPIFLTASFFQLNCSSVGHAGRPPSVNKGIKGRPLSYLPATCLQKSAAVSFPPPFYFPPTILIFLTASFFQLNCSSVGRTGRLLGQWMDQGLAAVIPACNLPEDLSFLFPPIPHFFSQLLFPI